MSGQLQREIKQSKPFACPEEELLLNLVRSADYVVRKHAEALKPHGISAEQYNVLRILRGAGEAGMQCNEIGARMVTRSPDVTRLLDRMEAAGLVQRERSLADRRVVMTVITKKALERLVGLDRPLLDMNRALLQHLPRSALKSTIAILEQIRTPESAPPPGQKTGKAGKTGAEPD